MSFVPVGFEVFRHILTDFVKRNTLLNTGSLQVACPNCAAVTGKESTWAMLKTSTPYVTRFAKTDHVRTKIEIRFFGPANSCTQ